MSTKTIKAIKSAKKRAPRAKNAGKQCSVHGSNWRCQRPAVCKGMCRAHYTQVRRNDTTTKLRGYTHAAPKITKKAA